MASTITLQAVVDWARTFTRLVPIVGVGGFSEEPALSICNDVLQEILAPTFPWKFNRVELPSFVTVDKQQDYTVAGVLNIGWLENCVLEEENSTATPKPRHEIEVAQSLPLESIIDGPSKVALLKETSTDSVLRFWPLPGTTVWRVYLNYQAKAPLKTELALTWSPLPDELAYVYRQGFLAMALKHADDARAPQEYAKFQAMILKALGQKDAEPQHEAFFPARPIMIG